MLQAASGRRPHITVFGQDYDTPDGTCIRDYVHIHDLCEAHLLALKEHVGRRRAYRLATWAMAMVSVKEVIETARAVSGRDIEVRVGDRRPGDPARLVADAKKAKTELGWTPRYEALDTIIAHAWQWENGRRHSTEPKTKAQAQQDDDG